MASSRGLSGTGDAIVPEALAGLDDLGAL